MKSSRMTQAIVLALAVPGAYAQQADTVERRGLEEIVVTAQRRAENLQEVPVTVTAVTAEGLEASGVSNIQSLSSLVPSLSVIDPTGFVMPFIRGVGSSTLGPGTFASVATYIDGVYVARTTNGYFEIDSAESVQVLAGPQGALYGRNATAGAVVVTSHTPRPGDEFSGNVTATIGNYDLRSFSGKISGSLSDTLAFSLRGAKHDRDGYIENLNPAGSLHTQDLDDRDAYNVSGVLQFEPSERVSFTLRGAYYESNDRASTGYQPTALDVPGGIIPGLNANQTALFAALNGVYGPAFGDQIVPIAAEAAGNAIFSGEHGKTYDNGRDGFTNGLLTGKHPGGSGLYIDNALVSLSARFELDPFTVLAVTGYTDSDYNGSVQIGLEAPGSALSSIAGGGTPIPLNAMGSAGFSSELPSEVFSQSIQLVSNEDSAVKWIVGGEYSKEEGSALMTADFFGFSFYSADNDFDVESIAVFAQATVPFGNSWAATGGVRYTDEEYSIDDHLNPANPLTLPGSINVGSISQSDSKVTYTGRLEYQGDDWLAYGGISTGFKSGILNAASPALGAAKPEEVTSYELGYKRDFGDRFRFNASLYYQEFENIHVAVIEQRTGASFITNGPEASVYGIDLQTLAQVTDNFQLSFSATALDTEFDGDAILTTPEGAAIMAIDGNRLPGASDFTASIVGDLDIPLDSGFLKLTTTVYYNNGMYYEPENLVATGGSNPDSYTLVNLNLSYTPLSERWSVSIWGNNIFDEEYYRTGIVALGGLAREAIIGNPATYGLTAKVNF
ncbi:MAG: TonB-dependent receptor [Porticoccaceae bacterium]